jgi:hypothetical protein
MPDPLICFDFGIKSQHSVPRAIAANDLNAVTMPMAAWNNCVACHPAMLLETNFRASSNAVLLQRSIMSAVRTTQHRHPICHQASRAKKPKSSKKARYTG